MSSSPQQRQLGSSALESVDLEPWRQVSGVNEVWKYKDLPAVFGAKEGSVATYRVETKEELEGLFKDEEFSSGGTKKMRFVELVMPWDDAPEALKGVARGAEERNSK